MAKKFAELRARIPAESQARAKTKAQAMLAEMPLYEIRQARKFSQVQLADALNLRQPAVSKLERRTDMYISTMRRFVEAMGGQLEIRAKFPDGVIEIAQFEDLEESEQEKQGLAHA